MKFPRQEYWSGLPFPVPGDLPSRGSKPPSPSLASGFFTTEPPGKPNFTPIKVLLPAKIILLPLIKEQEEIPACLLPPFLSFSFLPDSPTTLDGHARTLDNKNPLSLRLPPEDIL